MICQATQNEEARIAIPSRSPDGPYHLSIGAAERLRHLALRPREWFNLATIHGPFEFYLHDDFYDENGEACQPEYDVEQPARYPCPALEECAGDAQQLLNFSLTRWYLRQPVIEAFSPHAENLSSAIISRYAGTRNPWFRRRLMEIAGSVLKQRAEHWFRGIMGGAGNYDRIQYLRVAYQCLSHAEGLQAAQESLYGIAQRELAQECLVLACFRDRKVLDWIELNITDPLTFQWGDLAAVSAFDWDRAEKWLRGGRPLSLVALDAMCACVGSHPGQSRLIQEFRPHMDSQIPASSIDTALREYARRDSSPRVRKAVNFIIKNLSTIIAAE